MSLQSTFTQNCPHCNLPQQLRYYTTVNVSIETTLKTKVLDGSLNAQACTDCSKEINFRSPFLYHDMDKSFMIQFNPAGKMDELSRKQILNDLKGRNYIHREVHHYPRLLEKIEIFSLGINDELIEKIKADLKPMLLSSLKVTLGKEVEEELHIFFEQYEKNESGDELAFAFFTNPKQVMGMKYKVSSLSEADQTALFDMASLRR